MRKGYERLKLHPTLILVAIPLGVYISWFLGTVIMNMRSHIKNLRSCLPMISKHSKAI